MVVKATSFTLDWYNCCCCYVEDMVHEKTTVYFNKRKIKLQQYNGYGNIINEMEWPINKDRMHELFECVEELCLASSCKNDYSVEVVDGSEWKLRIRYSDRTSTLVQGTVEMPPFGKKIENFIIHTLEDNKEVFEPRLFGCL